MYAHTPYTHIQYTQTRTSVYPTTPTSATKMPTTLRTSTAFLKTVKPQKRMRMVFRWPSTYRGGEVERGGEGK